MPDFAADTTAAPTRETARPMSRRSARRPTQRAYEYTAEGGEVFVIQRSEVGGGLVYDAAEYEAQLAAQEQASAAQKQASPAR